MVILYTLNLTHSVGKTELFTLNDIRKTLDTKAGFLIIRKSVNDHKVEMKIYFVSCYFAIPRYEQLFSSNPNQKLEESQIKFYHYNSFEEIEIDYPNEVFCNLQQPV